MFGVKLVKSMIKNCGLSRLRNVGRWDEDDARWMKRCMTRKVDETRQRGHTRRIRLDCINEDMKFGKFRDDAPSTLKWRTIIK